MTVCLARALRRAVVLLLATATVPTMPTAAQTIRGHRLQLVTAGYYTRASLNGGAEATVQHFPQGTWRYLGQGFHEELPLAGPWLELGVTSTRTRVTRPRLELAPSRP